MFKAPAIFSTLNWYKWGAIALFYVASVAGAFYYGQHQERLDQAEQKVEQAEEKTRIIVQRVKERIPEVQKDDEEAARLKAEIAVLRREVNEAINARPDAPECALSNDELRYFQEAARRTH